MRSPRIGMPGKDCFVENLNNNCYSKVLVETNSKKDF